MSASLLRFMDREKYLLAGLVYFHLPVEIARRDFESQPLALSEQIELLPWCETGSFNPKGPDGTDIDVIRAACAQYRAIYQEHAELHDLRLTGYINDNAGPFSTTDGKRKTGLVAMAYQDGLGNGIVVFSGCETQQLVPMVKDYADCMAAAMGVTTRQQRRAMAFYDHAMQGVSGERGIIGHSKGGNLATYVYINRLEQPLQVYCINAQPFCWWTMTREQQAALKSDRYEFIAHAGDIVHHAGYVSYVSRIVQMNPYLNRRQVISLHNLSNMEFDSMGNLQGSRVLRTTRHTLKSRIFGDFTGEAALDRDAVITRFRALLKQDMEPARLLSVALEEMGLATHVDTVLLLLRLPRDSGDILYTCQARGDSALRLRDFRLRVARNDALSALLCQGIPVNVSDTSKFEAHFQPLENVLGWHVRGAHVIPLGGEDTPWMGTLELLSRDHTLSAEDMALAVELGDGLAQLLKTMLKKTLNRARMAPLLRLRRGDQVTLELERHDFYTLRYRYKKERDAFLRLFVEGRLARDESLRFDGWNLSPTGEKQLRNWRKMGVAVIGRAYNGKRDKRAAHRQYIMLPIEEAAQMMGFSKADVQTLEQSARLTGQPILTNENESETIRARFALCLTHRPALLVFDTNGCAPETIWEVCAYLRLLCYDKLATVLVLQKQ